jgi:hypothetical protein
VTSACAEPAPGRAEPAPHRQTLLAVGWALGLAIAGAVAWGLVALLVSLQLPVVGLLIGLAVGTAVARFRPGHRPTIAAGGLAVIAGCALGPFLTIIFVALGDRVPPGTILGHLGVAVRAYPAAVGWEGLVFSAAAVAAALWLPLRRPARSPAPGPGRDRAAA